MTNIIAGRGLGALAFTEGASVKITKAKTKVKPASKPAAKRK